MIECSGVQGSPLRATNASTHTHTNIYGSLFSLLRRTPKPFICFPMFYRVNFCFGYHYNQHIYHNNNYVRLSVLWRGRVVHVSLHWLSPACSGWLITANNSARRSVRFMTGQTIAIQTPIPIIQHQMERLKMYTCSDCSILLWTWYRRQLIRH